MCVCGSWGQSGGGDGGGGGRNQPVSFLSHPVKVFCGNGKFKLSNLTIYHLLLYI